MARVDAGRWGYIAAAVFFLFPTVSCAQTAPSFRGKTITIYVGNPVGGGYDLYGRLLARHFGRHIPGNPTVVVSNMPGAASILCANFLYNSAPRDGTALGVLAQNFEDEQVFGTAGVLFDASRFNWIGRITSNVELHYTWHTVPVKSIADLQRRETVFAAAGPSAFIYPLLLNNMIGTKFKLIRGYPGTQDAHLAMQRGEIEGAASSLNALKTMSEDWLVTGKVNVLVQHVLERHRELPSVPAVVELAQTEEDRSILAFFAKSGVIGRSIVAPPDMPTEHLTALRNAFDQTMMEEEFLADARRLRADVDPMSGIMLQESATQSTRLSDDARERARAVRGSP